MCAPTADYRQAPQLSGGAPDCDAIGDSLYGSICEQPRRGVASADAATRAPDAALQVGRPSAAVRVRPRRGAESLPSGPTLVAGGAPPPTANAGVCRMGGGDLCLLTEGGGPPRFGRKAPSFDQVDNASPGTPVWARPPWLRSCVAGRWRPTGTSLSHRRNVRRSAVSQDRTILSGRSWQSVRLYSACAPCRRGDSPAAGPNGKTYGTAIAEFGPDLIGLVLPPVGMLVHGGVFAGRHALGRKKPPPVPPSSEHIREQLARTLSQRAAAGPVVAVIDDLHWADHASIELLFHLARTLSTSAEPLVIIGTYRPADARIARERFGSPLETMINELRRYSLCFYVDLDAIVDPVGSRSFCRCISGSGSESIHRRVQVDLVPTHRRASAFPD